MEPRKRRGPALEPGPRNRPSAVPRQVEAIVTDLTVTRRRRVDQAAGPWWPSWRCCHSWTAAS
jgi:hypothetical protein